MSAKVSRRWSRAGGYASQRSQHEQYDKDVHEYIQKPTYQESRLWVLGGALRGQASALKYDLSRKEWTTGPSLLQERDGPVAVTSEHNVIYVVGGKNHSGPMASVEKLEPNHEWQVAPSLQTARRRHAAVRVGSYILALGGLASKRGDGGPIAPNEALQLDVDGAVWETMACCRVPRWGLAAVALKECVYVLGGIDAQGSFCSSMEIYSLSTDSWIDAPPMHVARCNVGAVAVGKFIYAAGGRSGEAGGGFVSSVERFSLEAFKWEKLAPLQTPRCCCEMVVWDGKIFALGGYGSSGRLSSVECFDPVQQVWMTVFEMPGARNCMAAVVSPGFADSLSIPIGRGSVGMQKPTYQESRLWVLGGALRGQASALKYDLSRKEWTTGPSLLQERDGPVAVTSEHNVIYVVGGKNHSGPMASVEKLEPNHEWQVAPSLQTARRRHAAVRVGSYILALGGLASKRGDGGPIAPNEALQLDVDGAVWETMACCRVPRWGLAAVALKECVYVLGGIDAQGSFCSSMEIYSLSTDSWIDAPPMQTKRCWLGVASTGGFLYALGGRNGEEVLASVERFNLAESKWEQIAPLQTPRWCCAAVLLQGHIFVIGGYGRNGRLSSIERFDPVQQTWVVIDDMPAARNWTAVAVTGQ
eukprot:TRINITY_DN12983_c0_g1_i1.p1 TRINITY_DN12983_c0_g1~~TRINITY_DN12983_c0_g1_i1.p1  ORF type:complete len:643 (-),score=90.79 TRINITY_DN12983_c0_g1_i1:157-2085(-)